MKHLKSLYEYFDSEALKVAKFDKKKFIADYHSVMNTILVKILANNEYLNEFSSDIIKNNIIFYYIDKNTTKLFKIHIIKNEDKYLLSYGGIKLSNDIGTHRRKIILQQPNMIVNLTTDDIESIEMNESFLLDTIKTTVYGSFLKFKNNIDTK